MPVATLRVLAFTVMVSGGGAEKSDSVLVQDCSRKTPAINNEKFIKRFINQFTTNTAVQTNPYKKKNIFCVRKPKNRRLHAQTYITMAKLITIFVLFLMLQLGAMAQLIPNIKLTTIDGTNFQTQTLNEISGKPVVLSFWATWCIPCLNELSAINDNLDEWKKDSKFEFYAIAQDDSRTAKKVPALVSGKGWDFNVLLDKNQDLKRELNIMNIPYTMVIKDGKIIYRQTGYVAGNENDLYKIIKENQ